MTWDDGLEPLARRDSRPSCFSTVNDQPTLWDSILPPELLVLPVELGRVDALLDDPVFFAPFAAYFDARIGRPSIPMETYLRLMFLKFRYRLGYESLCREVSDSISWQRFCRIPFGTRVPHPTTLMKITTRCGDGRGRRAQRGAAGQGGQRQAAAHRQGPRRHHRHCGCGGLSDRFRSVGQGDRFDGPHRGADQGRRWRDPHSVAGPAPLGRAAGPLDRCQAAAARCSSNAMQAQAAVRRITGELAGIAEQAMREATAVIRNARRALRTANRPTQRPVAPGDQRPEHPGATHRTHCGPNP